MGKSLWIIAMLFAAIVGPNARAGTITDGTFNFTVTSGGGPTPTGSFVWDNTTNTFTSFTIQWDGAVFDFSTSGFTLSSLGSSGNWCAASPSDGGAPCIASFFPGGVFFLDCSPGGSLECSSGGVQDDGISGSFTSPEPTVAVQGTYSITETVATPEPTSVAFMLLGVGFVLVARKRIA
jgi:hypothetical protein